METVTCSTATSLHQYILVFDDELMIKFVGNPLIVSIGYKTKCRIALASTVVNRSVRPGVWDRYFIVNIIGIDQFAIETCNRLIERHIPAYRYRQRYKSKSNVTLFTSEWLPDNSPVGEAKMRMGPQRSKFGNLRIYSPYANNKWRAQWQTPWKCTTRENLGHYDFCDIYSPILAKVKPYPGDYPVKIITSHEDIAIFNLPNQFDRYTTYKAIDNENINLGLQDRCLRFLEAMKCSTRQPAGLDYELDPRQSSRYHFDKCKRFPLTNELVLANKVTCSQFLEPIQKYKLKATREMYKSQPSRAIKQEDAEMLKSQPPENNDLIVVDMPSMNENNQNSLLLNVNQSFNTAQTIAFSNISNTLKKLMKLTKLKKSKKRMKLTTNRRSAMTLHRYMRLYLLKYRRKCINYKFLSILPSQGQSDSEITFVSSDLSSTQRTSTKASKSSNFDDDTLDSLRSL